MSTSRWLLLGFLTLALTSTWLAAQPPRKEEEEEPPAKEKDKEKARPVVPVPVEPEKKGADPAPPIALDPVDPDVGTFKEEAAKTTNADAKAMFRALILPYDRIEPNFQGGLKYRIELLLSFPLFAILFVWYLAIGMRSHSSAQDPETFYRERWFMAYVLLLAIAVMLLLVVDIPWLQFLVEPLHF